MSEKKFRFKFKEIQQLIPKMGACFATDSISVDGNHVHFMYRTEPHNDIDSGWQFYSGFEDQEYIDDPNNTSIFDVNTIANHDPAIIPYLDLPVGTELERIEGTDKFLVIPG